MNFELALDGITGNNMSFTESVFSIPVDIRWGAWLFWSFIIATPIVILLFFNKPK